MCFDYQASVFFFCFIDLGLEIQISKSFGVHLGSQGGVSQLLRLGLSFRSRSSPKMLADVIRDIPLDFHYLAPWWAKRFSKQIWLLWTRTFVCCVGPSFARRHDCGQLT